MALPGPTRNCSWGGIVLFLPYNFTNTQWHAFQRLQERSMRHQIAYDSDLLIEQGETQVEAARILKLPRGIAKLWLKKRDSNRRTRSNGARLGRRPIISDEKVQEMIEWITGHFNRRVLPL